MKVRINREFFKKNRKKALSILKKGTAGVLVVATVALSGCSRQHSESHSIDIDTAETVTPYTEEDSTNSDITYDEEEKILNDQNDEAQIEDAIDNIYFDFASIEYKNNDNAFTRDESTYDDTKISISEENYVDYVDYLGTQTVDIPYSDLFNLEHLNTLPSIEENVSHNTNFILTNGLVDADKLYRTVLVNNNNIKLTGTNFYKIENSYVKEVCKIIAESVNYELKTNPYADKEALICNLSILTILGENDITAARVTTSTTLLITPSNIEDLQNKISEDIDAFKLIIAHESKHLFQLNCFHEADRKQNIKMGFNQKWSDEPINSLFWKWYYEASAEMLAANQNGIDNIVYETNTNYLKYLKLTMLLDSNFDIDSLEQVSISRNRDDFYELFGASTESQKLEIAKIMYALEIVQNENSDFEKLYLNYTGRDELSAEDWENLKAELKVGVANNLAVMFYQNLAAYIKNNDVTLNDLYFLLTLYEAEVESHLSYDSPCNFNVNSIFMSNYAEMQQNLFRLISNEYGYSFEEIEEGFNLYSLREAASLSSLSTDKKLFLIKREMDLIPSVTTNIATLYETFSNQYEETKTLDLK